jgi:hypothetical protein
MTKAEGFSASLKRLCKCRNGFTRLTLLDETLRHIELIHGRFPQPLAAVPADADRDSLLDQFRCCEG